MSGKSLPSLAVRQLGLVAFFLLTAVGSGAQSVVKSPEDWKMRPPAPIASRLTETDVRAHHNRARPFVRLQSSGGPGSNSVSLKRKNQSVRN